MSESEKEKKNETQNEERYEGQEEGEKGKSGFHISILLIWIITAFAVILSLISLAGLIITKQKKVKNALLEKIKIKTGIEIGNVEMNLFPLVRGFEIKIERVKFEDAEIEKIVIKPEKIDIFSPYIRLELGGGGEFSFDKICSLKEITRKIPSFLFRSVLINVHDFKLDVGGIEFDGNIGLKTEREKISVKSDFSVKLKDEITKGIFLANANIKAFEGEGILKTEKNLVSDTRISFTICDFKNGTQEDINAKVISNVNFDLSQVQKVIGDVLGTGKTWRNINSIPNFKGTLGSVLKSDIRVVGGNLYANINIDSRIFDFEIEEEGKAVFRSSSAKILLFGNYENGEIKGGGEISSDKGIEKLSFRGIFYPAQKRGKFDIVANLDLSAINGIKGKVNLLGDIEIPEIKGRFTGGANFVKIDNIGVEKLIGEFEIKRETIKFKTIISHGISDIRGEGEYNISEGKLSSNFSLLGVRISDVLDILDAKVDINGSASGELKAEIRKNVLSISGNIDVREANVFGEKIDCVLADLKSRVKIKSGKFEVSLEGRGFDGVLKGGIKDCDIALERETPNSFVIFRTEITSKGFDVSLEGKYELGELDLIPLKIKGESDFSGKIGGSFKNFYGEITFGTDKIELSEFPVVSSCSTGKITITPAEINVDGDLCEEFHVQSTYFIQDESVFLVMRKDDTEIRFDDGELEGEGSIATISRIIPLFKGIDGVFSLYYDVWDRKGKIKVDSESFSISKFDIKSFSFVSEIKKDTLDFLASGIYSGDEIKAKGIFNSVSRRISGEINFKNFAGIPLNGELKIIGDINSPNILGNIKIRNFVFTPDVIERVKREVGISFESKIKEVSVEVQGGEIVKREEFFGAEKTADAGTYEFSPNFNISILLEDVVYETGLLNITLNGRINISGSGDETKIFGIFNIKDGQFAFAGVNFKNIEGIAFLKNDEIFVNISGKTDVITFDNEIYRINAKIIGNIKSPNVYLSSSPSLPESDIVCVIGLLRKCESIEDVQKVVQGMIYRNISLVASTIEKEIGVKSSIRPSISPSEIGITGKMGEFYFSLSQNFIEDINKFSLIRYINQNTSIMFSWDDKRYGFSTFGNIGNIGMDVKLIKRF